MADEEKKEAAGPEKGNTEEKNTEDKKADKDEKSSKSGLLTWIIMAVVVTVCAGSGFGLSRLLASRRTDNKAQTANLDIAIQAKPAEQAASSQDQKSTEDIWYYNLEPLVANLDEHGATRFIRVTLTLEFSSELPEDEGEVLLESKMPILTDWLNIYLGGLSIADCSGKNKKGIQTHICDNFNEKLFPDSKPMIIRILFKEFNIQ